MSKDKLIIGAVAGDIIGSVYEWNNVKTLDFDLFCYKSKFTDDSVLTLATMYAIINQKDYAETYQSFSRNYPNRGYGGNFRDWIASDNPQPYNSWGNGSAMRVSPVGWYGGSLDDVMAEARRSAEVTHNHPEGIKGAQSTAAAIYMARTGKSKDEIKKFIVDTFQYNLDRKIDDIRRDYAFDESCQGSVPEAIIAFLESTDFENAIRLAISIGGDSDTIACITGGIAEAYYQAVPENIIENVLKILPDELIEIIEQFSMKYRTGKNHKDTDASQTSVKRSKFTPDKINSLQPDEVFVFGSNLAGHHGGGAAFTALNKFGAIYGQGTGLQGQSYAIPTMQGGVETIVPYVDEFIHFAEKHPEKFFYVTRIGCGIAGFQDEEIAPLFAKALELNNVALPESFAEALNNNG